MNKIKTFLLGLLSVAIMLAPAFSGLVPEKLQTLFYALIGGYEVAVRYYPTVLNYSLVTNVFKLIGLLAPNRKAFETKEFKSTHE